jgi:hypothetical protein
MQVLIQADGDDVHSVILAIASLIELDMSRKAVKIYLQQT